MSDSQISITANSIQPAIDTSEYDTAVNTAIMTVAHNSAKTYKHVFASWRTWTLSQNYQPLLLIPTRVNAFLANTPSTRATRRLHLSALRKLAIIIAATHPHMPELGSIRDTLKLIHPTTDNERETHRDRRALTPAQVENALNAWPGDTLEAIRNRTVIAVLFLSGIRRAEAAAIRWIDIDFHTGVITIPHAKGDKYHQAALIGNQALRTLQEWQHHCPNRVWAFPRLNRDNTLGPDIPITPQTVYLIVNATAERTGIKFS